MAEKEKLKTEYFLRAKYWKDKANNFLIPGKEDFISGFVYLWISMNVIYNFYCNDDSGTEYRKYSEALKKILDYKNPIISSRDFYASNEMECWDLIKKRVNNDTRPLSYDELNKEVSNFDKQSDFEKLMKIFEIIYRIRCNLLHGSKGRFGYESRDIEVLKTALPVLKTFVENILK